MLLTAHHWTCGFSHLFQQLLLVVGVTTTLLFQVLDRTLHGGHRLAARRRPSYDVEVDIVQIQRRHLDPVVPTCRHRHVVGYWRRLRDDATWIRSGVVIQLGDFTPGFTYICGQVHVLFIAVQRRQTGQRDFVSRQTEVFGGLPAAECVQRAGQVGLLLTAAARQSLSPTRVVLALLEEQRHRVVCRDLHPGPEPLLDAVREVRVIRHLLGRNMKVQLRLNDMF